VDIASTFILVSTSLAAKERRSSPIRKGFLSVSIRFGDLATVAPVPRGFQGAASSRRGPKSPQFLPPFFFLHCGLCCFVYP
jgi:hypothetical protein